MEYNCILDAATKQKDSLRRLAFVAVYSTTVLTSVEKSNTKPFNPLLGETFELVTPEFKFISEQVSHHPPVTAFFCEGKEYSVWSNNRPKTKFTGKNVTFTQMYNFYVEFPQYGEKYEIRQPVISAHNLIIGSPYVDLGGKSVIRNCTKEGEKCVLEYHRRGWTSTGAFKVDGEVFNSKGQVVFNIDGNWNSQVVIVNPKKPEEREVIWTKTPYPEKWEQMYGFSKYML